MGVNLKSFVFPAPAGVEEDDGMVELSLGLSIGGVSSRNAPRASGVIQRREPDTRSGGAGADRGGSGASMSSYSPPPPRALPPPQLGELADGLDPQRRRQMHARRRQEARKKRHERKQQNGLCGDGRNGAVASATGAPWFHYDSSTSAEMACSMEDRVAFEVQEQRARVRDREAREDEPRHSHRRACENYQPGSGPFPVPELCSNANANPNVGSNANPTCSPSFSDPNLPPLGAHPFPVMAMQYPFPQLQYVPMGNGFGFPYMMPYWPPTIPSVAGGPNPAANVFQPLPCRTLIQPFSAEPTNGASPLTSQMVDPSGATGTGMKRAPSWSGSLGSNSASAISDHQSNSLQGGSSATSDTKSHSGSGLSAAARSRSQLSPQVSNLVQGQSEHSISSPHMEPEVDAVEEDPSAEKRLSSNSTKSSIKGDSKPTDQCDPARLEGNKSVTVADESIPLPSTTLTTPLPQMPCVSTTGNGPNGKTITGFLYRYNSTEVSIVCVCHGSSFSPAEFVKHAGGTDIANPLRHIIVVP